MEKGGGRQWPQFSRGQEEGQGREVYDDGPVVAEANPDGIKEDASLLKASGQRRQPLGG